MTFWLVTPAAIVGMRNSGSGRIGTTEARVGDGDGGAGRGRARAAAGAADVTFGRGTAATRGAAGARRAASQRARRVLPMPRTASVAGNADRPTITRHSAGAHRRTMSSADLRPNSR